MLCYAVKNSLKVSSAKCVFLAWSSAQLDCKHTCHVSNPWQKVYAKKIIFWEKVISGKIDLYVLQAMLKCLRNKLVYLFSLHEKKLPRVHHSCEYGFGHNPEFFNTREFSFILYMLVMIFWNHKSLLGTFCWLLQ